MSNVHLVGMSLSKVLFLNAPHSKAPRIYNFFVLLVSERGEGRERNISVRETLGLVASCSHPKRGPNPATSVMCPDLEMNLLPFGLQDDAQQTEPHCPGRKSQEF